MENYRIIFKLYDEFGNYRIKSTQLETSEDPEKHFYNIWGDEDVVVVSISKIK